MTYLLDSNAWIALFRQKSALLLNRLQQYAPSEIALCSVVLRELWYGAIRSGPAYRTRNEALIDDLQRRYASLHSMMRQAGIMRRFARISQVWGGK